MADSSHASTRDQLRTAAADSAGPEPRPAAGLGAPAGAAGSRRGDTPGSRRGFLASVFRVLFGSPLAIGMTTLAATLTAWLLATVRFLFPNALLQPPTRLRVGGPEDYAAGRVETRFAARHGFWVVRGVLAGQPQMYALRAVCTHLGCTPIWQEGEQKFKCPCHGSGFTKEGMNYEGPAPRPLERYAIRVAEDGQLEVDKGRVFRQELGEWSDPASYVEV